MYLRCRLSIHAIISRGHHRQKPDKRPESKVDIEQLSNIWKKSLSQCWLEIYYCVTSLLLDGKSYFLSGDKRPEIKLRIFIVCLMLLPDEAKVAMSQQV